MSNNGTAEHLKCHYLVVCSSSWRRSAAAFHVSLYEFSGFFSLLVVTTRPHRQTRIPSGGRDRLLSDFWNLLSENFKLFKDWVKHFGRWKRRELLLHSEPQRSRGFVGGTGAVKRECATLCPRAHVRRRICAQSERLFSPKLHFSTPLNGPPCWWGMRTLPPLPRRLRARLAGPVSCNGLRPYKASADTPHASWEGCGDCRGEVRGDASIHVRRSSVFQQHAAGWRENVLHPPVLLTLFFTLPPHYICTTLTGLAKASKCLASKRP